jgi:hypothetical protein
LIAAIQGGDARVVPLADLAQEDVGQQFAVQLHRARGHARHLEHRHHAADHRRELRQAELFQFFRLQRGIGGAEVHRACLDLGDAAAGADRLVVDLLAGRLRVVGGPFRHDRIDERGAGAGDVCGHGAGGERGRQRERGDA